MPAHIRDMECCHGGPVRDTCSCHSCCLFICSVCGGYEGGLTTDCCSYRLLPEELDEVYRTRLDFVDEIGWHQGKEMKDRRPNCTEPWELEEEPNKFPSENYLILTEWNYVHNFTQRLLFDVYLSSPIQPHVQLIEYHHDVRTYFQHPVY